MSNDENGGPLAEIELPDERLRKRMVSRGGALKQVGIRMEKDLYLRLVELCTRADVTIQDFVCAAVAEKLRRIEGAN